MTLRVANIGRLLDASKVVDATFLIKPLARFRKCADILTSDIMIELYTT